MMDMEDPRKNCKVTINIPRPFAKIMKETFSNAGLTFSSAVALGLQILSAEKFSLKDLNSYESTSIYLYPDLRKKVEEFMRKHNAHRHKIIRCAIYASYLFLTENTVKQSAISEELLKLIVEVRGDGHGKR